VAAVLFRRLLDQLVVALAVDVAGHAGRRVALPEGVDEDLALRVGTERQERRLLALLNDRRDVEQELPVLLRQVLDALFPLSARELGLGEGGGRPARAAPERW